MKELKILSIIIAFTVVLYIGVEPFAHSQMHKSVEPADFSFKDLEEFNLQGDADNGKTLVVTNFQCQSCHAISSQKIGNSANLGVIAPDLSTAGAIYTKKFLFNMIKDPTKATQTTHKFGDSNPHPMPTAANSGLSDQDVADIVAYLVSIAPKLDDISNKQVFADACQRCHGIKYADMSKHTMEAFSDVSAYLKVTPPDLSQMIRSRGEEYLEEFINEPAKHLKGTAMPRVGLNEEAQAKIVSYLEEVGDSHKQDRDSLGVYFLLYLIIFAIFAWAWKIKIWKDIH